jgi:inosine-uridine nucleoside N-ribohydrolase
MVGKNVCHTVEFGPEQREMLRGRCAASKLFCEAADLYLARHGSKKFHDPTAAVCHLHPEVAQWVRGRTVKRDGGWGTVLDEGGDFVASGLDYEALWDRIAGFS